MKNRCDLVVNALRYEVAEGIENILQNLSFEKGSVSVPDWKLFTRNNEFVAIYYSGGESEKGYLLGGTYSSYDVLQDDLSVFSELLNQGTMKRLLREGSVIPPISILVGSLALGSSLIALTEPSLDTKNITREAVLYFASFMSAIVTYAGLRDLRSLLNKRYAKKLSKSAENYSYGKAVEKLLEKEHLYERIKSGKLSKEDFKKLRGFGSERA